MENTFLIRDDQRCSVEFKWLPGRRGKLIPKPMIKQLFRKNTAIGLAVIIAVFVSATTASADHFQLIQQELNDHRQLWQSLSIDDYNYRFQNMCFCGGDFVQPGLVHVLDGEIVSVEHIMAFASAWLHKHLSSDAPDSSLPSILS